MRGLCGVRRNWPDPPLSRIIERYISEHTKAMGATKGYALNILKASPWPICVQRHP
jgi:hypothetical protein